MENGAAHWRYEIIEMLGEGGTSQVYRARDAVTGAEVALKYASGEHAAPLKTEYVRLHRLRHPGLVRALDFHRAGDRALLSLELLEDGGTPRGDAGRAVAAWADLASALAHLHANGLVHGDVKPGNVRFSGGKAKLIDLGMAGSSVAAGRDGFSGTPAYAAPEALEQGEVTAAGDVYGLGLAVWEMLGGGPPPPAEKLDPGEAWLKGMPPGLEPAAAELLRSMLRYRPADRVGDGTRLAWAMAGAGLMPERTLARELPFGGRAAELRRAMAARPGPGRTLAVGARPGTGGTRFLEELKFLLQLSGLEALMDGGGQDLSPAPVDCVLLLDAGPGQNGRNGRPTVELRGWEAAGADGIRLRDLGAADYRAMLDRLLRGADPGDLDRLAEWLGSQAGGHVKTAAALAGALFAGRLAAPGRLGWEVDWQGLLSLDAGAAAEGVWSAKWAALGESSRGRLKSLALSGSGSSEALGAGLDEWARQGGGGTALVGEAARAFAIGRCSADECRGAAAGGGPAGTSPALLEAHQKAGNTAAWLDLCRNFRKAAADRGDREAELHYSMMIAGSTAVPEGERRTAAVEAAVLCRRLARYRLGLELLERHAALLENGWEAAGAGLALLIAAGQSEKAAELAGKWAAALPPGRESIEARLQLGLALAMGGDRERGRAEIGRAAAEAAALGDKGLMLQAEERLASLAQMGGDWRSAIEHARAGLELAGPAAGRGRREYMTLALGVGLAQTDRLAEAIALLEGFLAEPGEPVSRPELAAMRSCLGQSYMRLERWDEALDNLESAGRLLARSGDPAVTAFIAANTVVVLGAMDRHQAARRKCLEAFRLYREAGDADNAALCLANAGYKDAVLGRPDRARRLLGQALEMAPGAGGGQARLLALKHLGLVEWEQRRLPEARELLEQSRAGSALSGAPPHFEAVLFGSLAALGLGDEARALAWADAAADMARGPRQTGWAEFAKELAMAQKGGGRPERLPETMGTMRDQGNARDAALMALAAAESPAGPAAAEPWGLLGQLVAAEAEFERLGDQGLKGRAREAIVATARVLVAGPGPSGGQAMLEAFYQLAYLLKSGAGPDRVGREAVEQAVRLSDAERGGLFVIDASGRPSLLSGVNLDPETERDAADFSLQAVGQAAGNGAEVLSDDAQAEEDFRSRLSVRRNAIRSLACMPIRFREGGAGALYLDSRLKPGVFSAGRLRFLRALADMSGAVVEASRMMEELRAGTGGDRALEGIIGESAPMQELKERIRRAAPSGVNVLIEGETGTGKELAARAIHELSPRRQKAFIALDCGSLPETLLESELFGCAKGAFTGAHADKPGLFEAADGGTLFLDEITSASQAVQARLLRVVEEGEIRRVGETRARKVDVRLICAANKNMEFEVSEGRFKQDLYFRLNGFRVAVPPLRDRGRDILELAEHFRRRHQRTHGRRGLAFTAGARSAMASYPWPGNIRELDNAVQKAVIMAKGDDIDEAGLELPGAAWLAPQEEDRRKKGVDRRALQRTLRESGGDTAKAAERLGISQRQVQRLIKKHRLAT